MNRGENGARAALVAALLALTLLVLAACSGEPAAAPPEVAAPVAESVPAAATPCADEAARCAIDLSGNALAAEAAPNSAPAAAQGSAFKGQLTPVQQGGAPAPAAEARIPREIARVALATGDAILLDLRVDAEAGLAWVSDSERTLHVVDLAQMAETATLTTTGDRLVLDATNHRLYVGPDRTWRSEEDAQVTLVDTRTRTIVKELPGERVAVDERRNRVWVGDRPGYFDGEAPGVRLYEGATLELLAQGELAGEPLYNPARDELIVVNYSAFTVDPETLAVRTDLFPEISGFELRACNGCKAVNTGWVFAEDGVVALDVQTISAGKGAGYYPPPLLYDAATMEPIATPASEVVELCGSRPLLNGAVDGQRLAHRFYSRYLVHNNLEVLDTEGALLRAKDGLSSPFVNPRLAVAYVLDSAAGTWVLDHSTLEPLATLPVLCLFEQGSDGTLYAADDSGQTLVLLAESGGASIAGSAADAAALGPERAIRAIVPSPAYATDNTIFLVTTKAGGGDALLRTTDGGASWITLGGLPGGQDITLALAISPAYASDRTLYAGGLRGDYAGIGVWVSQDGGESWSPRWHGLEHLRVNRVELSPRFAQDQTLLAWARFDRIQPWDGGYSIHRSTDGGLQWTRVITAEYEDLLPAASVYLPIPQSAELPIRKEDWYKPLEVKVAGGVWTTATVPLLDEWLLGVLPAPQTDSFFVVTNLSVLRTEDGGRTWQRWADAWLEGRDYMRELSAAGLTDPAADGSYWLLLGTRAGELQVLDPAAMPWVAAEATAAPVEAAAPEPVVETPEQATSPVATPQVPPETGPIAPPEPPPPTPLPETPPAGLFLPEGQFASQWTNDGALRAELGFARTRQPESTNAASQSFENGQMFWREDTQQIVVLLYDGTWSARADTFKEGEPERDPNLFTPGELLQPERGFGKLWRSDPELQAAIGWATAKEAPATLLVQEFERGWMLTRGAQVYVLTGSADGGHWR